MAKKKQAATIELTLDPAEAAAGVDREALVTNVAAEIEKLEGHAKSKKDAVSVVKRETPPPQGAQDVAAAIHWLITFAENPALAPTYVRGLIFGVNELVKAVQNEKRSSKTAPTKSTLSDEKRESRGIVAVLKVFGKEIALPVANKMIEEFLKSLSAGN